jgi:photosystem II stability/assembly factor-like uncharacterized protein
MKRTLYGSFLPALAIFGLTILAFPFASKAQGASAPASAAWSAVGPDGGNARAFAYDPSNPQHIYLGTTSSWIYETTDGGLRWKRLAHLGKVEDLVVDNLLVDSADPKTIYAGVWQLDSPGGGVYITHDGGESWMEVADMSGKSVRALTQAPSNSKVLVAGAISGVFRSEDGGVHWAQISPEGSGEIHKVESIAIDPADARTIYAGTWHMPWKTADGGATWHNITKGLIDDSDVFSILIDPKEPSRVYLSACSGIYLSETGGELFRKVQGIPATARRTRVLMQDPTNRKVVYAGTTEGLYKTVDGGAAWSRMTGPDVIINDVYVDPKDPQHVLLATDRSGVLSSGDAGASFTPANAGFSQRQVAALLQDGHDPKLMYAGVVNDKSYGGVFVTNDGGRSWGQSSAGLDGRDVFSLAQAADGTILAGTNSGIFRRSGELWQPDGKVVNLSRKTITVVRHRHKIKKTSEVAGKAETIGAQVNSLSASGPVWFAATAAGVYRSADDGATWTGPVLKDAPYEFVDAQDAVVFAAGRNELQLSTDSGMNWQAIALPQELTLVNAMTTTPAGLLWVGGRQGVFYSDDRGQTWHGMENLPVRNIDGISYDAALQRVMVTASSSTLVFAINSGDKSWKWWNAGWKVRMVRSMNGRLVAASLYDGVVVEPAADGAPSTEEASK